MGLLIPGAIQNVVVKTLQLKKLHTSNCSFAALHLDTLKAEIRHDAINRHCSISDTV